MIPQSSPVTDVRRTLKIWPIQPHHKIEVSRKSRGSPYSPERDFAGNRIKFPLSTAVSCVTLTLNSRRLSHDVVVCDASVKLERRRIERWRQQLTNSLHLIRSVRFCRADQPVEPELPCKNNTNTHTLITCISLQGGHSPDQIPWHFQTFQVINCRASTLATVAIRNEMHDIFITYFVLRSILAESR